MFLLRTVTAAGPAGVGQSTQVVGLRDRVAIIRALLLMQFPPRPPSYGDLIILLDHTLNINHKS